MKKLTLISLLLAITIFASCDGKDRARLTLEEKITNNEVPKSFFEKTAYFPKEYTEVETDTILNNGYRVHIKTFSDMNNSYVKEFDKDTIKYKHHYRDFLSSITVWKDDKEIFFNTIDKEFFEKKVSTDSDLNNMTFHNVWLDEQTSTYDNAVIIKSLFCKPETDDCIVFKMTIDNTGYLTVKEEN